MSSAPPAANLVPCSHWHPLDKAQANYDLARACHGAGDASCAMNSVVAALEVAPDFKPAQKLLLELNGQ